MRREKTPGFVKIGKDLIVDTKLQGRLALPIYVDVHKSLFLVRIEGDEVTAKTTQELRELIEARVEHIDTLTWQRWIRVLYVVERTDGEGRTHRFTANPTPPDEDDEPEPKPEDCGHVTEINLSLSVFDLSSPITLTKEAKAIHARSRWNDAPDQERIRIRLRWQDGRWAPDRADDFGDRVDVDLTDERDYVHLRYSDERWEALLAIQAGLGALDTRLRGVLDLAGDSDTALIAIGGAMQATLAQLAAGVTAGERTLPPAEPTPTSKKKKARRA